MVKHIQTIRGQITGELFESVWPFCDVVAWGVKKVLVAKFCF